MSLRRSARARVPASDADADADSGERRKRKRSTMTPESGSLSANASPSKGSAVAASPPISDTIGSHAAAIDASSPPSTGGRPLSRKIVVKSNGARKSQGPETNGVARDRGSSGGVLADLKAEEDDDDDDGDENETLQELSMSDEDREKLETVIKAYDPDLLTLKSVSRKQTKTVTLQQLLSQSQCSIRSVREHILSLRAPLTLAPALRVYLASSHITEQERDRRRLSMLTMLLAIVEELGERSRSRAGKIDSTLGGSSSKRAPSDDDYALHMRLPSGDFFTNAVRLPANEAQALDTAYSKLVTVASQPALRKSEPVPTFKDRLPVFKRPPPPESSEDEIVKPVSHLYYDPWSSFAPTYDSFDGTVGLQASSALWKSKKDDRVGLEKLAKEPQSQRQVVEEALQSMKDVDADAVLQAYDTLEEPASLERNAALLNELDRLQAERWKRTFAKRMLAKSAEVVMEEPSEEERQVAGEILDVLTKLLSQHSTGSGTLRPSIEVLRAASSSACIDPALLDGEGEPGYWGSLNEVIYGPRATRRVPGARSQPVRPPAVIRDNETIRLEAANDEKVSATLVQAGASMRGKGLLERFASGRQYTLEDHPHDRKLVVAGSQQPMPPQSPHPRAPSNPAGSPATPHQQSGHHHMSPPMSTPPARPYYSARPGTQYSPQQQQQQQQQQQHHQHPHHPPQQKGAYFRPPGNNNQRNWSQSSPSQQQPFYPTARPHAAAMQ